MGRHRRVVAIVIALVLATAVYGSAASLGGLNAQNLGAGGDPVESCDKDGVTVSYSVSDGIVTGVTVSGIAARCSFGQMSLTLSDAGGASIGSGGPAMVTGTSRAFAMNPQPKASDVAGVHIVIEGP